MSHALLDRLLSEVEDVSDEDHALLQKLQVKSIARAYDMLAQGCTHQHVLQQLKTDAARAEASCQPALAVVPDVQAVSVPTSEGTGPSTVPGVPAHEAEDDMLSDEALEEYETRCTVLTQQLGAQVVLLCPVSSLQASVSNLAPRPSLR